MATGPRVALTPMELLTSDLTREEPYINKFWSPLICATVGFAGMCFVNFCIKRPTFSGIQQHAGLAAIGAAVGQYFEGMRLDYFAERDAVLRHYITLHPEDFPPFERKKYADLLQPWMPIR